MGGCAEDQEFVNVKMNLAPSRDDDFHDGAWPCNLSLDWDVRGVIALCSPREALFYL